MGDKIADYLARQSRWRALCQNSLLLNIIFWSGALSLMTNSKAARANLQSTDQLPPEITDPRLLLAAGNDLLLPQLPFLVRVTPDGMEQKLPQQSSHQQVSIAVAAAVASIVPIDTATIAIVPVDKIISSQYPDLMNINGSNSAQSFPEQSINLHTSTVALLLTTAPVPVIPVISSVQPELAFSQPRPIIFDDQDPNEQIFKKSVEPNSSLLTQRLATISQLKITDPSFQKTTETPPELPKQQILLAKNTQLIVGVKVLEANDFTDTINPLFDRNDDGDASRFGSRSGIYYLVAGSGVGIRHQFSPNLEGSIGILFRSSVDSSQNSRSGSSMGNNKLNNNKSPDSSNNNGNDGDFQGGSISNSHGTIAQITYTPSENIKLGLTYVYGYNVNPEIGSESANMTDGINSAFGFQTSVRVDPNLALSGWVGFNQNRGTELNKNIFTWAVTAAILDLGRKGNLAGLIIGQEPRVIAASNLTDRDTGSSLHLESFYKIKINDDFSITPAIIYLTGSNIDNIKSDSGSMMGMIGLDLKF